MLGRFIKIHIIIIASLALSGCWYSDTPLISSSNATDPFGKSVYYSFNPQGNKGKSIVLQKKYGNRFTPYTGNIKQSGSGDKYIEYRFERFRSYFFLGSMYKYIVQYQTDDTVYYAFMTIDEAGYIRLYQPNENPSRKFYSVRELYNAFKKDISSGKLSGKDYGKPKAITKRQADAWVAEQVRIKAEKERQKRAKEKAERERAARARAKKQALDRINASRLEAAARAARQNADREPTQYEMRAAMRRTVAGQILAPNPIKVGACRKVAAYDYMCRYRLVGLNMGNFWKTNGAWYFRRVDY